MSAALTVGLLWGAVLAFYGYVVMEEHIDRSDARRFEHDLAATTARIAKLYEKAKN